MGDNLSSDEFAMLRRLQSVPRWTIVPTIRRQTVDGHSFHTAVLALLLAGWHRTVGTGNGLSALLIYALKHDQTESISGDLPSPYKRRIKEAGIDIGFVMADLEPAHPGSDVVNVVKCADCLEALMFLREEQMLGNRAMNEVVEDIRANFVKHWDQFDWDEAAHGKKPDAEFVEYHVWSMTPINDHPGLI